LLLGTKKTFVKKTAIVLGLMLAFAALSTSGFCKSETGFSIIVLPDTQKYSESFPQIFDIQTNWIANQAGDQNIVFVMHLGDIVQDWNDESQWQNASKSIGVLDGNVPNSVLPGNHDMSSKEETEKFNQYFGLERYKDSEWFGGSYPEGTNDNSYQFFSAGGKDYITISLKFCPDENAVRWANSILQSNLDKKAIVATHGYLGYNGERHIHNRNDNACGSEKENTQYIWDEIIYPNENIFLVLSGHVHGAARRTDPNIAGTDVYQILSDYQSEKNGGNGWLRIMEFLPGENRIRVKTFSPYLNEFKSDSRNEFFLGECLKKSECREEELCCEGKCTKAKCIADADCQSGQICLNSGECNSTCYENIKEKELEIQSFKTFSLIAAISIIIFGIVLVIFGKQIIDQGKS